MDRLFRKYLNSVLNPDEYSKVSDFLTDVNNEEVIYDLIKPFWDKDIHEADGSGQIPNPELRNKIIKTILLNDRKTEQRNLAAYTMLFRIAAVLVIGLLISTVFFFRKSKEDQYAGQLQTISTPYGAKTNLTLPDGSLVWLNSGSSISYYTRFGKTRLVSLKGEAFFEVEKNGKPFIVLTQYGDIEVKGTVFNVKAYAGDNFETTLEGGTVTVKEKSTGKKVILQPGQQAGISDDELMVKNVETDLYSSWKDGKLIFRDEYLPEVAKRLERWYNVKIELGDDKRLSVISFTGTLEMESFSEVLHLLEVTAPIDYSYNEKTRTIKITYKKN